MQIHKVKGQGPASFGQSIGNCLWPCKRNSPSVKFRKEISVPKLITRGRISSQVPEVLDHWGLVWSSGYDAFLMRWTREQFPGETLGGQAASPQLRHTARKPTASSRWLSCEKKDVLPYLARDLGEFFPDFWSNSLAFSRGLRWRKAFLPSLKHVDAINEFSRLRRMPFCGSNPLQLLVPILSFPGHVFFSKCCQHVSTFSPDLIKKTYIYICIYYISM